MVATFSSDNQMSHYDEVLYEARKKGETIANKYIFELYTILMEEEHLPPEDCRAKIEQDCMDLWSKTTIRKFLPEEAKNPKKSKAGKIGAQHKKEKLEKEERIQVLEQTINGNISTTGSISHCARTDLAENCSVSQEQEESRRFHKEVNQELADRGLSPELLEASRIISEKDSKIKELEDLATQGSLDQLKSELYLPSNFVQEIYDLVRIHGSKWILHTDFILHHDGRYITSIESLNSTDSLSEPQNGVFFNPRSYQNV